MDIYTIIAILIGLDAVILIFYYNKFVSMRNKIDEAWSAIDLQLHRRYELIESLQEIIGNYSEEEKQYLDEIAEMKHIAIEADDMKAQTEAESKINLGLKKLFAFAQISEEIKNNKNFKDFQQKISEIEDETQKAIRYYNALVRDKNKMIEKVPNNLFAKLYNVSLSDYFNMQVSH